MFSIISRIRRIPYLAKQFILPCIDWVILVFVGLLTNKILAMGVDVNPIWLSTFAVFGVGIIKFLGVYKAVLSLDDPLVAWWKFLAGAGVCYAGYYIVTGPNIFAAFYPTFFFLVLSVGIRLMVQGQDASTKKKCKRIAIYGAGACGIQIDAAIELSANRKVCLFIDDDKKLHGRFVRGKPVISADKIKLEIIRNNVTEIIIAIPSIEARRRNQLASKFNDLPVNIFTAPGLDKIFNDNIETDNYKPLSIDDLLQREPVAPNLSLMKGSIEGEVVLVTGAGGSIGSELCRQISKMRPLKIVLLEKSEYALYEIDRSLRKEISEIEIIPYLGSICDGSFIERICLLHAVSVVFHTAAYKHVPMVERNVIEAITNNVLGTLTITMACENCGVKKFVLISTDKAVRPTNVMGASKRICELILQARASHSIKSGTTYCMVRFGNVLGSSGSVVPLFREQIEQGGPITLTDLGITRYFMNVQEAAQLVLQAATLANNGDLFVLNMGNPVLIFDLAKAMIRLSGLSLRDSKNPEGDIEIKTIGLRPGEKMFEELLIGENPTATLHPKIMRARETYLPWADLESELLKLQIAACNFDHQKVVDVLERCVKGYKCASISKS